VDGAITADNMPFVIGIQIAFQFMMMAQYGYESEISIDTIFAMNDKKVPSTYCFTCSTPKYIFCFLCLLNT
jgi:hypothetical protein